MPASPSELHGARAIDVKVTADELTVDLEDGRSPFRWSGTRAFSTPAGTNGLDGASSAAPSGFTVDEDISIDGLLAGRRSNESQASLKRWLQARGSARPNKRMKPTARGARRG